jgi:hypothetical protein
MKYGSLFFFTLIVATAAAQIRIEVISYPKVTGGADPTIFISGTFNAWSPGDENYKLSKDSKGTYFYELPDTLTYFEYKFTQGAWSSVEGSAEGKTRSNRVYSRGLESNPKLLKVEIESWETQPTFIIIVRKLPKNTPFDASIYVMGDFNNWNPADISHKLTKQVDGSYRTIIYGSRPQIQFKFTRGTTYSVESKPGGRLLTNRIVSRSNSNLNLNIDTEIAGWLDLPDSIQLYYIYDLLLLFSFLQGILLIITIPGIQGYNRAANRWLLVLIGFTSVIILIRVVSNSSLGIQFSTKLQLLPDFIFFIYAPLFYFYIQKLLFQSPPPTPLHGKFHFVPALIQFFVYVGYLFMDNYSLLLVS